MDIIFLDVGGTLLFPAEGVGATYAAAAARHGLFSDGEALESAFRATFCEKVREGVVQDRDWWRDLVRRTFRRVGEGGDVSRAFEEVYELYAGPSPWRLADGARKIGPALRARGYRTGVISNWDLRLRGLLDACGLAEGMEPIVVSGEVGAEKPDPRIYATAIRRAGVPAERALMVGDDPEADYAGARAAGLQAILVPRDGGTPDAPFVRTLLGLLDRLPPRDGAA